MSVRRGGATLGGGAIVIAVIYVLLTGRDPQEVLQQIETTQSPDTIGEQRPTNPEEDQLAEFISVVLADTEDTWTPIFAEMGRQYTPPTLVLFTDSVESACGMASAASGPFYCPADRQVYIDLGFYRELKERFGAPGDFAQAYVIAHEIGHHVQNELGIGGQVHQAQQRASRGEANDLSVRLELQADCLAGVWGYHADRQRQLLESGDVEEGLGAAAAIGDDRIQRMAGRRVSPESFTHGSSEQRVAWFRRGLASGDIGQCETFDQ